MTMSLRRHDKSFMNNTVRRNTVRRSMSSSECRRWKETAWMWGAAEDCKTLLSLDNACYTWAP